MKLASPGLLATISCFHMALTESPGECLSSPMQTPNPRSCRQEVAQVVKQLCCSLLRAVVLYCGRMLTSKPPNPVQGSRWHGQAIAVARRGADCASQCHARHRDIRADVQPAGPPESLGLLIDDDAGKLHGEVIQRCFRHECSHQD
jgi:hypothetical protein